MVVTKMVEADLGSLVSVSPSFNSYSSEKVEDIAARVIEELHTLPTNDYASPALYSSWKSDPVCVTSHEESHRDGSCNNIEVVGHGEDDEGFEFSFVSGDNENSSPISADEIFFNGQIRPIYPIFDQSLLFEYERNDINGNDDDNSGSGSLRVPATSNETALRRRRPPLRKLMLEERGTGSCSSSASDPDDVQLNGVEPGTYCVWNPKSMTARDPSCKKLSKSTGSSSKRWKLLDLVLRSQSDGKDSLVFVSHKQTKRTSSTKVSNSNLINKEVPEKTTFSRAVDAVVTEKEAGVEKAKRRTMLPSRPDIVGLFHNVNGVVGRNLHPF